MPVYRYDLTVDTATTPPTITAKPVTTTPTPTPTPGKGYRVSGRALLDPNGDPIVPVGVEQRLEHVNWIPPGPTVLKQIGLTGANTVRILPNYRHANGLTPGEIDAAIAAGLNAGMFVEVAVDGGQDPGVYLDPPILAVVKKWQTRIALHAMGESQADDDNTWAAEAKRAVASLRGGGITCPLYVMSRVSGRSLTCLLNKAGEVQDADELHNTVFGWQAYWGLKVSTATPMTSMDGYYQRENGLTLQQAVDRCAAAPVPIQVGLMYHSDPNIDSSQVIPYREMMAALRSRKIGWLWWDYREGPDDLTKSGTFGDWTTYGREVIANNTNGITKAAVRTSYLNSQRV